MSEEESARYTWVPHTGVPGHGNCAQVFGPDGNSFFSFDPGPDADGDAQELCDKMNVLRDVGLITTEMVVCKNCGYGVGKHSMDTARCPTGGISRWGDTTFSRFVVHPEKEE